MIQCRLTRISSGWSVGSFVFLLLLFFSVACEKKSTPVHSDIKYLQNDDIDCAAPSTSRLEEVQGMFPQNFVRGFTGNAHDIAMKRLALIPNRDLKHLIWTYDKGVLKGIYPAGSGIFGVAGLTTLVGGSTKNGHRGMVAISVTTTMQQVGFALQHEVGHAVEIVAEEAAAATDQYSNFSAQTLAMRSEMVAANARKPGLIRSYAMSNAGESWAEAYANFYCSPESNRFIKDNLPKTYQFLRAVLEPPVWENGGEADTDPPSNGGEVAPRKPPADASGNNWFTDSSNNAGTGPSTTGGTAGGGGFWDSLLGGFLGNSGTTNTNTPAPSGNSTNAGGGGYTTVSSNPDSIAVALVNESKRDGSIGIMFASVPEITQIHACASNNNSCSSSASLSASDKSKLLTFRSSKAGRNFYRPQYLTEEQKQSLFDKEWTIRGFDDSGRLIAVRRVRFATSSRQAAPFGDE
jgi:hypothetical protein